MSATLTEKPKSLEPLKASKTGAERRRRKRAKISAQLRVRPAHAPHLFQEICKTIDVSRDGLLFTVRRKDYARGQRLEITFPYTDSAVEYNQPQMAEVVRAIQHHDGTASVAVEFLAAREDAKSERKRVAPVTGQTSAATAAWTKANERPVVLAVEPDTRSADVMRLALQQEGYDVLIVPNSKQALEAMRKMVPAVVIAEVESPEISGHDLCVVIKKDARLQSVPVILMTRAAQPADYSASHSLGAVICMAKPFKTERLQHVVKLVAPPPVRGSSYSNAFGALGINREG
jgi:CheY-like chemotaxis protein